MEICPKCKKKVDPPEHLHYAKANPLSQIECSCGYYGLPLEVKDKKKDK